MTNRKMRPPCELDKGYSTGCVRDADHTGDHRDVNGATWRQWTKKERAIAAHQEEAAR